MAEAEFTLDEAAHAFVAPHCIAEVTDDVRFTGRRSTSTDRSELLNLAGRVRVERTQLSGQGRRDARMERTEWSSC
jgi:hypothetical protein